MVVSTVSTSPAGTFHVVPPPPPRPRQWSELVIAIALALFLNLLFIAPFLLTNPVRNPPAEPPSIAVDLVPEEQAPPPPPPPAPEPEPEEEVTPPQERSFTRSGGEAEAPPGPEAEDKPATPEEAPEVEPEPEPEPAPEEEAQAIEKKKEVNPLDIPDWARTVEPGYAVPARPAPPAEVTGKAGGGDPYLNAMWARVRANLVYPREAGGRTGVARFEVVLHRSGQVVAMKLVTSAGHPALDRAAREAIERSLPFAPFPPEVRAEAVPLIASIPVAP